MIQATAILEGSDLHVEPLYQGRLEALLAEARAHLGEEHVDEAMLRRAFRLAYWAHRNDQRASGELYIAHPIEVARIVARDIAIDDVSIAAALLHDVVEDTDLSLDLIRAEFGDELAQITDGLTKIRGVFQNRALGQAENVRKLMLSMATDLRVILVKFADRLHNMRTLEALPPAKRLKIASETLDLFAPLAHRFGLHAVKVELEDLSLRYVHPKEYRHIADGLSATREERQAYIEGFIAPLAERLREKGFAFHIYGRPKNIYSIWRKMQRQNKPLEEIYDLFAIRIILDAEGKQGKEQCWLVYSEVTDAFTPIPERFRDFISTPKGNGYQSLHTTVFGPQGRKVEVQIRTEEMHQIAERGVAAHWKYKEGVEAKDQEMERALSWVRDLLENPRPEEAADFVSEFRLNLYDEEIYVFTPKGDLMTLPAGATPVDFAYMVHTEVGNRCIGGKVNGKMAPLSHKLHSGDQVEIITSRKQHPNPDWARFVVTHKAQSRIRHFVKEQRRQATRAGEELWQKHARRAKLEELDQHALQRLASTFHFPNPQQMFYEIGAGLFDVDEAVRVAERAQHRDDDEGLAEDEEALRLQYQSFLDTAQEHAPATLLIDGEEHPDLATEYASCCNPIPGDEVFGYVSRTGVVKIHRTSCKNAPDLLINRGNRVVQVDWSRQKDVQFMAALRIIGEDRVGIVSDITTVISKSLNTNIRTISVDSDDGIFEGTLVLFVNGLNHLQRVVRRLRGVEGIHGVYRFEQ